MQINTVLFSTLVCLCLSASVGLADFIDLTVDPVASSTSISVAGSDAQTSAVSGTSVLDLNPPFEPFGTAQITDVNLVLDDGLNFSFLAGLVTASTAAGDIEILMITPGAPGTVMSGNLFDQIGNLMSVTGEIDVVDPLNLIGGNQTFDLSTLVPVLVDFNDVIVARNGDTVSINFDYAFSQDIDANGTLITVDVNGSILATGTFVPEPSAGLLWLMIGGWVAVRRRRPATFASEN